jgi:diguanylate cyclase (GGDEF)-like protein
MLQSKNRIMLLISLLLIGGFLLTSLASYFTSRASLRNEIAESTLPLTSDNIYSEIQRDLLTPIFISSLMASDTFLRDWVISGERDPENMIRYLNEIQTRYKTFTSFFVSDKTQIYYHASGILKRVRPEEPRDLWYYRVRKMDPQYEINVDTDLANQDAMTIFINHKVLDYQGNYLGATGVGLTVYAVKELVEEYQKRYQRNIYFVDRQGRITLRSTGFAVGTDSLQEMPWLAPLTETILKSDTSHLKYRRDGQDIQLNSRYIKEFDWYLLVEQAEGERFQKLFVTLLGNLFICVLITTIVLLITNLIINAHQKRIETMSANDRLTGIYNRKAFEILYPQLIAECRRSRTPFALVLFDIDNFKQINDTHGHLAGDAVLKALTELTGKTVRASDMFFRWGGDEFLLLLKESNEDHARQMAEKLRLVVETNSVDYEGTPIAVTISIGVAEALPGESENQLLRRGDEALYAAKNKGRNCTEMAKTPDPP